MNKIKSFFSKRHISTADWIKTAITTVLYLLLVVWIGNWWLLLLTPIFFDLFSTRIIPWGFWKKRKNGEKPSAVVEWIDAIIFALVAVYFINLFIFQNYKIPTSSLEKSLLVGDHLFVSKVSYGPRMPNTPLYVPMVQNEIFGVKSYLEWPMWDYHRLAGTDSVRRNDIVVFNFPAGDTVCVAMPNPDYYTIIFENGCNSLKREDWELLSSMNSAWERNHFLSEIGRKKVRQSSSRLSEIVWRPVDKRDCYVKRCIGMPGDSLAVRHNVVYINNEKLDNAPDVQHIYHVRTNGVTLNDKFFENMAISNEDRNMGGNGPDYYLPLTDEKAAQIKNFPSIVSCEIEESPADSTGLSVYPYSYDYPWSRDNYGPIWIPKKGATIELNEQNALLYERAITAYEGHTLEVRKGRIFIDNQETTQYTFTMDYYFMMGDNRHKSADSRYWGFVPEDHIIGRPLFVWLSLDPDKSGLSSIRWDRFFKTDFDRQ